MPSLHPTAKISINSLLTPDISEALFVFTQKHYSKSCTGRLTSGCCVWCKLRHFFVNSKNLNNVKYSSYRRLSYSVPSIIGVDFGGTGGDAPSDLTLEGAKYVWPPRFWASNTPLATRNPKFWTEK